MIGIAREKRLEQDKLRKDVDKFLREGGLIDLLGNTPKDNPRTATDAYSVQRRKIKGAP